jgi:hypothetical protein
MGTIETNMHDSLPMPFSPTHKFASILIGCVARDPLVRPTFDTLAAWMLPFVFDATAAVCIDSATESQPLNDGRPWHVAGSSSVDSGDPVLISGTGYTSPESSYIAQLAQPASVSEDAVGSPPSQLSLPVSDVHVATRTRAPTVTLTTENLSQVETSL